MLRARQGRCKPVTAYTGIALRGDHVCLSCQVGVQLPQSLLFAVLRLKKVSRAFTIA